MRRLIAVALLVGISVGLSLSPVAQETAQVLRVPQDAATIQEAIDAVADGGTILVAAGTWRGNLFVKKSLTLRGLGKTPDDVEIVAEDQGCPVILLRGLNPDIEVQLGHLTITGASIGSCRDDLSGATVGDGVGVLGTAHLVLSDVIISGNQNDGLHAQDNASVTVFGSRITDNGDTGLLALDEATVDVFTSEISGNGAHGLGTSSSGDVRVFGSTVQTNGENGIIAIFSSSIWISNATLADNERNGLYVRDMGSAWVFDSAISGNAGTGVYLEGSAEIELHGNEITGQADVGILAHTQDCADDFVPGAEFIGTVSGSANVFADNANGATCPDSFSFLAEVLSSGSE